MQARSLGLVSFAMAAIAVTSCAAPTGSSTGPIVARQAPAAVRPPTNGQTVIVSDTSQNSVTICGPGSPCNQCKTVGSGLSSPDGLTTSNGGGPPAKSPFAYVADSGNHRVVVFTAACTTVRILNDAPYTPVDVAVAADGTVAVTNLCESTSCGAPNIAFFAPKSTKIARFVKGLMTEFLYGAFDKKGDFYNDGYAGSKVVVGVVPRGSTTDKSTGISGIGSPGGLEVAKNGTANVIDAACPCIQIYKGSSHVGTVALTGVTAPVTFAFDKKNKHVWVTDAATKTVDELHYPTGGTILYQYEGFYEPTGVGVIPPAAP